MPENDGERLRLRATVIPERRGITVEIQECDANSAWMNTCHKQSLMLRNITRICEQIGK